MAKLSREELINRVNVLDLSDELKISLMEDITDSFEGETITPEEKVKLEGYDDIKFKYENLLEKYKERFTSGDVKEVTPSEPIELEEKEVIDVKEI